MTNKQHMKMRDFAELVGERDLLTAKIRDEIHKALPIGVEVAWLQGEHKQRGVVVRLSWDRVLVRANKSRKEYWLDMYRILNYWKQGGF